MPLDIDLYLDQGSDFSVNLTVTASDGTIQDLTGYTVSAKMRRSMFNLASYDLGATISDAVDGVITLSLPSFKTALFWPTRYVYDVTVVNIGSGLVSRVFEGIVHIRPGVTGTATSLPEVYEAIIYLTASVSIQGVGSIAV